MSDVEDVENYVHGGFHPVDIGDEIGPEDSNRLRYTVLHKLGSGGSSTVWLVKSSFPDMRYFALKILCANASGERSDEIRVMKYLRDSGREHPNVVTLHDCFEITGPNGTHTCLVLPVLGPSLFNCDVASRISAATRFRACQEIASGVAFLHEMGVCHGDITPSNVVFELPNTSFMSSSEVSGMLGPITTEKLRLPGAIHSPHAPKRVVQNPDFSGLSLPESLQDLPVRIVDFGQAFFTSDPRSSLGTPIPYFPPELCFGYSPSAMSDVWELACTIFFITNDKYLIFIFPIYAMLVGTAVTIVGPLPSHWKDRFDNDKYGYWEDGELKEHSDPDWWWNQDYQKDTIRSKVEAFAVEGFSAEQRELLVRLLEEMLVFDPEKRLSAAEAAQRLKSLP